jgi:diguanylate cyclase (GGDEF)-like protein
VDEPTSQIVMALVAEPAAGEDFGWLVLDSLHDATAVVDNTGVIVAVNAAWERFLAVNDGDPAACSVGADYLGTCTAAAGGGCHEALLAYEGIRDVLAGTRPYSELEYPCPSPIEDRWFLQRITPLRVGRGVVVSHVDITRRKRAELAVSHLASHDALTGLLNRRELERADVQAPVVLFLDLDGFKTVNDRLGHAAGDEVLARAANRILHQTRPDDRVARLGGDEFVVILADAGGEETAAAVAARIETAVAAPYQVGPDIVRIGASVGIARGAPGESLAAVVARADAAMYEAKRARAETRRPPQLYNC